MAIPDPDFHPMNGYENNGVKNVSSRFPFLIVKGCHVWMGPLENATVLLSPSS
jgi:hypothetical protein